MPWILLNSIYINSRDSKLLMNPVAMPQDARLRATPRIIRSPKITSPVRLFLAARSRVLETAEKTNGPENKEDEDLDKEAMAINNPLKYFKRHRLDVELNFKGCVFSPEIARCITSKLVTCSKLVRLCLANSRMENESGEVVAMALRDSCVSVKELDLSGNGLGRNAISAIGETLVVNQTLEKLNISKNDLTDQDVEVMLNCLHRKTGLKDVDLSNNILCDQSATRLSNVLEKNFVLEKLSIASNQLEATGLKAMQPGLRTNKTLLALNVSWNYLHDAGAEILGEIIAENRSLTEISACGNLFSAVAANWLAKGVASNSNLKLLRIGQNLLRNLGAYEFLNVLFESSSTAMVLEILDINGTVVDRRFKELVELELPENLSCLKVVNFSMVERFE